MYVAGNKRLDILICEKNIKWEVAILKDTVYCIILRSCHICNFCYIWFKYSAKIKTAISVG